MASLKFVGNVLWFVFGLGFVMFLQWVVLGALCAATIVGIPFAVAAFRIAPFAAFPFGRELIDARLMGQPRRTGTWLGNVLWVVLAGAWLAAGHLLAALFYFASLIGIPMGLAHLKLAAVSFAPLGKRIVSNDVAAEARRRHAVAVVDAALAKQAMLPSAAVC